MSDSHTGKIHSEETRAQMSYAKSGANNPMFGRTGANHPMYGRTGPLNPMYGKVPTHAMTINVYSEVDNQLVRSFSSQVAVAKWLGINQSTVSRCIKSGKVWNNLYRFVKSMS
jgi:group I intron endonuclease